ncbi:MAG: type II secretion system F family protein [bacterium]
MSTFAYKAKHGPDKTVDGEVQAENRAAAVARLERMGYSPLSIEELAGHQRGASSTRVRKIKTRDITVFTRQLGGLLRAGVPILRALTTIQQQTENATLRGVVMDISGSVRDGWTFSESLGRYPALFSDLYVNMVRSGESAGMVDEILMRLAEARESDDEIRSRVIAAIAYPALVLSVGVLSVFVILTFFLPRIMHLFEGSTVVLPWPTRVVMALSSVCSNYWGGLVALAGVSLLLLGRYFKTEAGRMALDGLLLRMPVIGAFARDTDIVRFARTLALLVKAGISVDRALALSGNTLVNGQLRAAVLAAANETVHQGATVAAGFKRRSEIPEFVTNMVAVGEESGRLDEALMEVAAFYQRELDRDLRQVTTLLEPALILLVGVVVGFIIFAMLLPIFQIGQAVR